MGQNLSKRLLLERRRYIDRLIIIYKPLPTKFKIIAFNQIVLPASSISRSKQCRAAGACQRVPYESEFHHECKYN